MTSFFAAAIRIMNRLKYPQKFFLVGSLLLIPTMVLLTQYVAGINADMQFAEDEQTGLQYNETLLPLLQSVQDHTLYASLVAFGRGQEYADDLERARVAMEEQFGVAAVRDAELGEVLDVRDEFAQLRADWDELSSLAVILPPEENLQAHLDFQEELLNLITVVGNNSNLILDPDIDSYYLMDTVITKLPRTLMHLSQLQVAGTSAIQMGLADDQQLLMVLLSQITEDTLKSNESGYGFVAEVNPALGERLSSQVATTFEATFAFLEETAQFERRSGTVFQFHSRASAIMAQHLALYERVASELDQLLFARIYGFEVQRNVVLTVAALSVLASAYFFVGFYLSVRRTIDNLSHASDIMISGQVGKAVRLDNRDELAEIVTAFNNVAAEMVAARDRALQANHLKDEFLATMSHELRTPLNSIIGYTGILTTGMRGKVDDVAKGMLLRIRESSQNLLSLINDILDIAKIEAGRMEIVDAPIEVGTFISQIQAQTEVLAREKELNVEVLVDASFPDVIIGDEDKLGQILRNLLSNAVKFTDEGVVRLRAIRKSQSILFEVTDTGIGIPPQALDYIFDEFRQVDGSTRRVYGGTGLGLAIVRKLCLAMGGRIGVQSKLGAGSTFTVTLPLRVSEEDSIVLRSAENGS
ncbi:MAG: ATP-binding protein [Chloroflexota bacterium]|nr:ATP-binding protein [Chloroflexota bacterium]